MFEQEFEMDDEQKHRLEVSLGRLLGEYHSVLGIPPEKPLVPMMCLLQAIASSIAGTLELSGIATPDKLLDMGVVLGEAWTTGVAQVREGRFSEGVLTSLQDFKGIDNEPS